MTNCLPYFDLDSVTEKKYKYFLREVEKYKIYTRTNLFLFLFLSLSNYSFQGHSSQVKSIGIWYVSQRVEIAKHGAKVWSLFVNVLIPIESRVAFRLYGFKLSCGTILRYILEFVYLGGMPYPSHMLLNPYQWIFSF